MNNRKNAPRTIDNLLKRVLEDDLPTGARSRMERVIRRFREDAGGESADEPAGRGGLRPDLFWLRPDWRLGRRILAFSSFLLIVLGGVLHLAGPRSAMADSIFRLNALISISRQVRLAETMDVSARAPGAAGSLLDYSLIWRSPGTVRIEVRSGGRLLKILTASNEGVAVEDSALNSRIDFDDLGEVQDPFFQPILQFISPAALANLIETQWSPLGAGKPVDPGRAVFLFTDSADRRMIRLSFDPLSLLPAEVGMSLASSGKEGHAEDVFLVARFSWIRPRNLS